MMKKNLISLAVGSVALVTATTLLAVPFNSFDPRSMAMGGAGVADANVGSAPFFNPALLSVTKSNDDFALELPILGMRVYDPGDFADAVDEFDDTVFDQLQIAIDVYNAPAADLNNIVPVTDAIKAMEAQVVKLSDKPLEFEGGGGMVIGIPSEKFGMAFSASGSINFSGIFNYGEAAKVASLNADLSTVADCFNGPVTSIAFSEASCLVNAAPNLTFITVPVNPANINSQSDITVTFKTDDEIESQVQIVGIAMAEVGLSFSREMTLLGKEVAVGITPKLVTLSIFDYAADADAADTDDFDGDRYTAEFSDANLDIGIARDHGNGWRSGFVIKNVISQDYKATNTDNFGVETETGTVVSLKPQARAGVSHSTSWSTVVADLDLTENEALGSIGDKSQYLALGVEFNAFSIAQLRVGYRADMVNSDRSVVSAGIGLSPLGMHIDLAVAGNENEVGGSFQLGFRF